MTGALHKTVALLAVALAPALASAQVNGISDTEVAFGMSCPLSGPAKDLGRAMKVGIETAFAAQNQAGGVNGRTLTLVAADDGYEPERTKAVVRELVEKRKVFGLVGNVGTPTAAVAVPYILEKGVLFFGALTGADLLRNDPPDRFVFNYRASYGEETAAAVKYLIDVRRIAPSQIAVFAQDDAYGDAGFEGVASMMRKYNYDPAKVLRVGYARNTTDVTEAVHTIKLNAARLKAVVMVPTYKAAARFIQKLRDEKVDLVFSAVSFVGSNALAELLTQLGPRYTDGVIVTQVVPLPLAKASATMKYQQDLAKFAPAEKPDFVSLEGYIAANLLIEGLKRAGRNLNTDTLVAALEGIKGLDIGIGSPLTFGPSEHQASHKVWLTALDPQGTYKAIHF
jgi:ABC-type branched-subunit amino acid transport system substrate-binding protein